MMQEIIQIKKERQSQKSQQDLTDPTNSFYESTSNELKIINSIRASKFNEKNSAKTTSVETGLNIYMTLTSSLSGVGEQLFHYKFCSTFSHESHPRN